MHRDSPQHPQHQLSFPSSGHWCCGGGRGRSQVPIKCLSETPPPRTRQGRRLHVRAAAGSTGCDYPKTPWVTGTAAGLRRARGHGETQPATLVQMTLIEAAGPPGPQPPFTAGHTAGQDLRACEPASASPGSSPGTTWGQTDVSVVTTSHPHSNAKPS